ncbi:hypothetical protein ACA910_010504 [Epithemia clementina (nom. ined.)]
MRASRRSNNNDDSEWLFSSLSRAERTLTTRIVSTPSGGDSSDQEIDDGGATTIQREMRDALRDIGQGIGRNKQPNNEPRPSLTTQSTTISSSPPAQSSSSSSSLAGSSSSDTDLDINRGYGQNPTITSTALAHLLWRHVLRPGIDSAIDATAGNGGDSVVLAQILFSSCLVEPAEDQPPKSTERNPTIVKMASELISVDIQKEACTNTTRELSAILPPGLMESNVQIIHGSHAPLPLSQRRPTTTGSPIALVVYNLGYLPLSSKECLTQTDTTLASMTDAVLCLRVGGMLSVMTYPRSNPPENWAVRVFMEGLALFSSNTQDWKEYVDTVALDASTIVATAADVKQPDPRQLIRDALVRVRQEGPYQQTWRVHEYRKLGWTDAPILLTAVRIK